MAVTTTILESALATTVKQVTVTTTTSGKTIVVTEMQGPPGPPGPAGEGVAPGGTAGQILAKIDAADFNTQWIAPPTGSGGGGSGTVTSVAMTVPTGLSVGGSPITTNGTFALTYASGYQGYTSTEATKLAGIASGATAAVWGGITGTLSSQTDLNTALGLKAPLASPTFTGTVTLPPTTNLKTVGGVNLVGTGDIPISGGGGSVTSVAMTVPTGLSIAGSPIINSGTLAVTYTAGYQGYTTTEATKLSGIATGATANTGTVTSVTHGGGTTGLTTGTSPITTTGTITLSGTLVAANGGTGQSTYAVGDLLVGAASNTLTKLADIATGSALISGGVGAAPTYGKIGLATHVSGALPTTNAGVPAGGTAGQVLSKINATDYNTQWVAGGGGSGTVTSVALSGGTTGLTVSGSPITTNGTITLAGAVVPASGGLPTGGTATQILAKVDGTSYNTQWVPAPSGTVPTMTSGSVVFGAAGGTLTEDNANLFWNNTTKGLAIGTNSLGQNKLIVAGTAAGAGTFNASGIAVNTAFASDVTGNGHGLTITGNTAAAAFNLGHYRGVYVANLTLGSGSGNTATATGFLADGMRTATDNYGFRALDGAAITAGRSNYSFYTEQNAATGGGVCYAYVSVGNAMNIFSGMVRFGSTSQPTLPLHVGTGADGVLAGFGGVTKGIRIKTGAGGGYVEAVDNTLVASFQQLLLAGSTVTLTSGTNDAILNGVVFYNTILRTGSYTQATLPSASATGQGSRAIVTNSNTAVFNAVVTTGGSNIVPVFSDGTAWKVG